MFKIKSLWLLALAAVLAVAPAALQAQSVPKPLKARFILGDPIWREIPVRKAIETQHERCFQTVIDTLLENKFDLASMDKDAGYARTTWQEGILHQKDWFYRVQVTTKIVLAYAESLPSGAKAPVAKVRIQVTGELSNVNGKGLKSFFRGYDQVILEDLFQDLRSKLGSS